jgi:hypothetical protein
LRLRTDEFQNPGNMNVQDVVVDDCDELLWRLRALNGVKQIRGKRIVGIDGDCARLADEMGGFHWMLCYGDYLRETGYALRKAGIEWLNMSEKAT